MFFCYRFRKSNEPRVCSNLTLISRSACNKTWKSFLGLLKIFIYTKFSYIRCTNHELFQPLPSTLSPFPSLFLYPPGRFVTPSATHTLLYTDGNCLLWENPSMCKRCNSGVILFTDATWTSLGLKSKLPHVKKMCLTSWHPRTKRNKNSLTYFQFWFYDTSERISLINISGSLLLHFAVRSTLSSCVVNSSDKSLERRTTPC